MPPVCRGLGDSMTGLHAARLPSMNETDIPCSDCGTELIERSVHARDLPVAASWQSTVRIAECPACDARHYPEQTLAELAGEPSPI